MIGTTLPVPVLGGSVLNVMIGPLTVGSLLVVENIDVKGGWTGIAHQLSVPPQAQAFSRSAIHTADTMHYRYSAECYNPVVWLNVVGA